MHLVADLDRLLEGLVQLLARRLVLRLQDALLGDGREVAVLQRDRVEAALPVPQGVGEVELLGAGDVLADQLAEVALAGDEADDRDRPVGRLASTSLASFCPSRLTKPRSAACAGEPEDQLVEEQDHGVVAQLLGVPADDARPMSSDRYDSVLPPDDAAGRRGRGT